MTGEEAIAIVQDEIRIHGNEMARIEHMRKSGLLTGQSVEQLLSGHSLAIQALESIVRKLVAKNQSIGPLATEAERIRQGGE